MFRYDCLSRIAPDLTDELVVVGGSGVNWEWFDLVDRDGNIHVGSMGHAASIACGLATTLPHRTVIALESDGSTLLDLAGLTVIGSLQPNNLVVLVFDNERYSGSRISLPTATSKRTDLAGMAAAAGIAGAVTVYDLDGFRAEFDKAVLHDSPGYVVAKVADDPRTRLLTKPSIDYMENSYRFLRHIEATEDRRILPGLRRI